MEFCFCVQIQPPLPAGVAFKVQVGLELRTQVFHGTRGPSGLKGLKHVTSARQSHAQTFQSLGRRAALGNRATLISDLLKQSQHGISSPWREGQSYILYYTLLVSLSSQSLLFRGRWDDFKAKNGT